MQNLIGNIEVKKEFAARGSRYSRGGSANFKEDMRRFMSQTTKEQKEAAVERVNLNKRNFLDTHSDVTVNATLATAVNSDESNGDLAVVSIRSPLFEAPGTHSVGKNVDDSESSDNNMRSANTDQCDVKSDTALQDQRTRPKDRSDTSAPCTDRTVARPQSKAPKSTTASSPNQRCVASLSPHTSRDVESVKKPVDVSETARKIVQMIRLSPVTVPSAPDVNSPSRPMDPKSNPKCNRPINSKTVSTQDKSAQTSQMDVVSRAEHEAVQNQLSSLQLHVTRLLGIVAPGIDLGNTDNVDDVILEIIRIHKV